MASSSLPKKNILPMKRHRKKKNQVQAKKSQTENGNHKSQQDNAIPSDIASMAFDFANWAASCISSVTSTDGSPICHKKKISKQGTPFRGSIIYRGKKK